MEAIGCVTNPLILGWSVGNEKKGIIESSEVQAILKLGPTIAAKHALVDEALSSIYGGSVATLVGKWRIAATTVAQLYVATNAQPPSGDIEILRRYYEQNYYSTLRQTVKSIDPNHLYFGSWILPGYVDDWPILAQNCDVIGFDDFGPGPLKPEPVALIASTNKPVLVGVFSFPVDYGGMRGFGWEQYTQATGYSDSVSGDYYAQRLQTASANPYFVGVEWFEYRDEPACGRGNTDGAGYTPNSLVVGENHAFGLLDVTDGPKYDLVNKVRAANLAALQSLGLQ